MMRHKYISILGIVGLAIVLPGGIARMLGAPIGILTIVALVQFLALLAFHITCISSLALCVRALVDKEWKTAGILLGAALIPSTSGWLAALANNPGFEGVMSV